jgi:WD40 repeat protein
VLNGGFPISYIVDKPSISVPGSLGLFEDEFRPWMFVLDMLFFGIVITLALEMGKNARQTIHDLRMRLGVRKTSGALIALIVFSSLLLYQLLLRPALQPCGWLDIAFRYSGCVQVFSPHTSVPSSGYTDVAFSRSAGILASSSFSDSSSFPENDLHSHRSGVRVWQIFDTWKSDLYRSEWTTEPLNSIAVSTDGMTLATGSNSGWVRLWQLPRGRPLSRPMMHSDPIMDVEFSPDGSKVASSSRSEVRVWSVSDGMLLFILERQPDIEVPSEITFSPDGTLLSDGAQVWRVSSGSLIRILGDGSKRLTVAFSPDGALLAVDGDDTEVELWQVSDGSLLRTLGEKTEWTKDISFSPDGQHLVSIPVSRRSLRLWRVSDGTLLRTIETPTRVSSVVFLPNGTLAFGTSDGRIYFWDVNLVGVTGGVSPTPSQTITHTLLLSPADPSKATSFWLNEVQEAIQQRLSIEFPSVATVRIDSDQLVVELIDSNKADTVSQMLLHPSQTIFFYTDQPYDEGAIVPPDAPELLRGDKIIVARPQELQSGGWGVVVQLNSVGGRIFDTWARANYGRFLVLAHEDIVVKSSRVVESISTTPGIQVADTILTIAPGFTEQQAKALATLLNSSELSIELELSGKD